MVQIIELRIKAQDYSQDFLPKYLSQKLGIRKSQTFQWKILRRSIDARKAPVRYVLRVQVAIEEKLPPEETFEPILQNVRHAPEVHIIGMGPCGLFAALSAVAQGWKPIIIERGKDIRERRRDLAKLTREGILNPNSNYCFGEGGAGTFSDGKLYTRSLKRGKIEDILKTLVFFGAPKDILIDAHPHIGTNKLPKIIENIRHALEECGAEIHFNQRVSGFRREKGRLTAVQLNGDIWLATQKTLLATGHSARDIFLMLHKENIALEAKALALGLRVEHPQALIDSIQYHCPGERPAPLPPASYSWTRSVDKHSVHSFCMCPGGIMCPAATAEGEVVVNGWSPSKRNGRFANSGIVVQVHPSEISAFENNPLKVMKWQQAIEQKAFLAGGGNVFAPAQRLTDFLQNKYSPTLPACSYLPGVTSTRLGEVFPSFVYKTLREGLKHIGKRMKGYETEEAIVVGVESRTSSPVKIPRDPKHFQHPEVQGLYPCGEGAGYAGGIMSAAIDGWNTAQAACMSVE